MWCLKPKATHAKEQIPRRSGPVVSQEVSCLVYLLDPSQALVTVTLPSLLCLEFAEERGARRQQQCPLSGSDQGFIVRKSPLSGTSLSASSNRPSAPHPGPSPEDDFKALWKWKVALLHKKKKIGGDKVINTYFVQESIWASILGHSFGLLEG